MDGKSRDALKLLAMCLQNRAEDTKSNYKRCMTLEKQVRGFLNLSPAE